MPTQTGASSRDSAAETSTAALVRLIAAGRDARALAEQLEVAQRERDDAILAAWSLGVGASAIAEKAGVTAARVQQIADAAGAAPRHQNRAFSHARADGSFPGGAPCTSLIDDRDPDRIAVWRDRQAKARTWTPATPQADWSRMAAEADSRKTRRLKELVRPHRARRRWQNWCSSARTVRWKHYKQHTTPPSQPRTFRARPRSRVLPYETVSRVPS